MLKPIIICLAKYKNIQMYAILTYVILLIAIIHIKREMMERENVPTSNEFIILSLYLSHKG